MPPILPPTIPRRTPMPGQPHDSSTKRLIQSVNGLVDVYWSGTLPGLYLRGPALLDDGTIAAPGLGFTADSNTGLRRRGADEASLVAGGSSGTNGDVLVYRWASGGPSVGVTDTGVSPSEALEVRKSQPSDYVATIEQRSSASGAKGLRVIGPSSAAADAALLVDTGSTVRLGVYGDGRAWVPGGLNVGTTAAVPPGTIVTSSTITAGGQLVSNAVGAAPVVVTATNVCTNLNADMVDTKHLADLAQIPQVAAAGSGVALPVGAGSAANVTGTVTLAIGYWLVVGNFLFTLHGAADNNNNAVGILAVASGTATVLNASSAALVNLEAVDAHSKPATQTWLLQVTAAATVQLRAYKGGGTGTSAAEAGHTVLVATFCGNLP